MAPEPETRGCHPLVLLILLAVLSWIALAAAFYIYHGGMP